MDTAVRLARFFGTSPDLWLNLQTHYELEKARDEGLFRKVEQDVRPVAATSTPDNSRRNACMQRS